LCLRYAYYYAWITGFFKEESSGCMMFKTKVSFLTHNLFYAFKDNEQNTKLYMYLICVRTKIYRFL